MKHQDQNPIETLESPMAESPLECQESNSAPRPYRAPHVLLVGKAKRLMAGHMYGYDTDSEGYHLEMHISDPNAQYGGGTRGNL